MYHPFSVTETLNIAWHILKKNFATIAVYAILAFIIFFGSGFVMNFLLGDITLKWIGFAITMIIVSFLFLGYIKLIFQLIDKEYYDFEFSDIVPRIKMILSYILLVIIISTIYVFVSRGINSLDDGLVQHLLGIFVAVIAEIFFLFYLPICACFIVDDNSGPFESVIQSFNLIRGNTLKYFLLFVLIEAMVFVGALTVIGLLFVVPFVNILLAVAYRKLVFSHLDVDDDISETV
jgi:uncharacterized membrane protein